MSITIESLGFILPHEPMPLIKRVPKGHKPNYKLMKYIIQLIKLNPSHWNQHEWRCGSSFCFAGFVDLLAAYQHDKKTFEEWFALEAESSESKATTLVKTNYYKKIWKKGSLKTHNFSFEDSNPFLDATACQFLGINEMAGEYLFKATNKLQDLERKIEDVETYEYYWTKKDDK
jgi:hypothetical protein